MLLFAEIRPLRWISFEWRWWRLRVRWLSFYLPWIFAGLWGSSRAWTSPTDEYRAWVHRDRSRRLLMVLLVQLRREEKAGRDWRMEEGRLWPPDDFTLAQPGDCWASSRIHSILSDDATAPFRSRARACHSQLASANRMRYHRHACCTVHWAYHSFVHLYFWPLLFLYRCIFGRRWVAVLSCSIFTL